MHADYIEDATVRSAAGDRTTSIHFYDSVVVFEVGERRVMGNQMTGDSALFNNEWTPPNETKESFNLIVENALRSLEKPSPERAAALEIEPSQAEHDRVRRLEAEINALRTSTSWRITMPLRALGRIFIQMRLKSLFYKHKL